MRRMMILGALLVLMLAGCSGTLFSEDFEETSDLPAEWQTNNVVAGVSDEDGILRLLLPQAERGERGHISFTSDPDVATYSVSARVRVLDGRVRLWARTDADLCSGYALQIDPTLDNYRLSQSDEGCDLTTVDMQQRRRVNLDQWYDLRLTVSDDAVMAFVDGVEFFRMDDAQFAGSTTVALEVIADLQGGIIEVDNLTISR